MSSTASGEVLKNLQLLFQDGTSSDLTDGELLDRFTCRRDESAFSILVERHGVMVLRSAGRSWLTSMTPMMPSRQPSWSWSGEHTQSIDSFQSVPGFSASAIGSPSGPGLTPFGGGCVSGGAPR